MVVNFLFLPSAILRLVAEVLLWQLLLWLIVQAIRWLADFLFSSVRSAGLWGACCQLAKVTAYFAALVVCLYLLFFVGMIFWA